MSRSKDKGTRFETDVCRYLRLVTGDQRIERRALHGTRDMGDLYGVLAHGFAGIVECKCHATVTPSLLESWRDQALAERGNADADFVALVVSIPRKGVARSDVWMTDRDMLRSCWGIDLECGAELDLSWSRKTLGAWARLLGGVADE